MKTLAALLLAATATAQVVQLPSGCSDSYLTCVEGSTPTGYYVSFDVHNVPVGANVTLYVGFANDPYWNPIGLTLPVDLGVFDPRMAGCLILSPMASGETVRAQTDYCRIPIFFPLGVQGPFILQAMAVDPYQPLGLKLSDALEYHEN